MATKTLINKILGRPCSLGFVSPEPSNVLSSILPAFSVTLQQKRFRGPRHTIRPSTRKIWWVRKWSKKEDVGLTKENESFVKDAIIDKYTSLSPLKEEPWPRNEYQPLTRRTGVLAIKLGIMKQWDQKGHPFSVTLLQVLDNHVINYIPPEDYATYPSHQPHHQERFGLQIVGCLSCDPRQFSKPYNGLFAKAGVPPKRWLTRFLITPDAACEPGTALSVNHFKVGQFVDVYGRTRDWGFQGVMKRWKMQGGPASHGVTKSHRRMGGTGGGGDKGGIWKGKHMPGIMGNRLRHQPGLRIWRINTKYNVLYVHGHGIPGSTGTIVRIRDCYIPKKRLHPDKDHNVPMPTWFPEDAQEPLPEEFFHDNIFQFSQPSIELEDEKP